MLLHRVLDADEMEGHIEFLYARPVPTLFALFEGSPHDPLFFLDDHTKTPALLVSTEDRTLTTRLRKAGDLLGIRLLDHLILGDDRLYGFADQGWPP